MEPNRISVDEIKDRMEAGEKVVFIDARGDEAWKTADTQIAGAMHVPPDAVHAHLHEVPKDGLIVPYCT